jgi:hydrogenase nickel incorporation protein HypA/HybF
MHEVSLVREMKRLVEQQAEQQQFSRVQSIHIELGSNACVSKDSLEFAFESVRFGLLEGTKLAIHTVLAKGCCYACGLSAVMSERIGECVSCGGLVLAEGGAVMRITELEVV